VEKVRIFYKQPEQDATGSLSSFGVQNCYFKELSFERDDKSITKKPHHHTGFEMHFITDGFQEYEVNGGQTLSFTIPKSEGDLPSLFPYKEININDTKFIKNGAFGSSVPYFSDKIKMLQDGVIEGGKDNTPNNATYLCTWLYKKDDDSKAIWVDRYYYPDFTSREKIITEGYEDNVYAQSKENFIDKINRTSNNGADAKKINKKTYFDKISDMLIREDTTYHYQRVSEKMVNEVLSNIEKHRISTAISNTNKELNLLD
jgi:hypothetical protein